MINENLLQEIIRIQDIQTPEYYMTIENNKFEFSNTRITKSSTPVTHPTYRGGISFTDSFDYKITGIIKDLNASELLSKTMLGPNQEFLDIHLTTTILLENTRKQIFFVAHLLNSIRTQGNLKLNLKIIDVSIPKI